MKYIKNICKNQTFFDKDYISAAQKDSRGNIYPVTIIMPTLAMEVKEESSLAEKSWRVERFIELLDEKIHEAKDM